MNKTISKIIPAALIAVPMLLAGPGHIKTDAAENISISGLKNYILSTVLQHTDFDASLDTNNDKYLDVFDIIRFKQEQYGIGTCGLTVEPAVTTPATFVPAEQLIPMVEPVRKLSSLHAPGTVSNICAGGNHTVIVQYGTDSKQEYAVIDLMNDTVTQTGTLESADEVILGYTPDGEIVSPELPYQGSAFAGTVRFYKNGKSRTISITPKLRHFSYSPAHECIYAYDWIRKDIIKIAADGTETAVCSLSDRSEFLSIYPERNIILTSEPSEELGILHGIACRSLQSGEILWQKPIGSRFKGGFTNGCVFAENIISDPTPLDDVNDTAFASYALSLADGELLGHSLMSDALSDYEFDQTGDFCASCTACINGKSPDDPESIRFTDLKTGKYDELALPAQDITKAIPYFVADTGCWVTAYTNNADGAEFTEICLCNPTIESSSPSAEKADIPTPQTPHSCDPSLADARKLADHIEQKYGVRILIGNEVLDIPVNDTATIVTTEGFQIIGSAGLKAQDYSALNCSDMLIRLAVIEQEMKKYPEGFFRGFQTPDGKGGLRISLYQQFTFLQGGDVVDVGGLSTECGAWYDMQLVDEYSFDHELFHLVEFRLEYMLGGGDNFPFPEYGEDSWMDLCPPNFVYSYDDSDFYQNDQYDQFILKTMGDDAYFISRYSTVAACEDRAELVSGLFDTPYWATEPYPNMLALYQNYPHIMDKLDRIADRLRSEFGSVYWEEIYAAGFDPQREESDIISLTLDPDGILSYYGL